MGIIICIAIRVLMNKVCPLDSPVLTFLTGLPEDGPWRRCNPKRSLKIQECKDTNMVIFLEMEVVGTVTHRHISLIASLGEYFSPLSTSLFYIIFILLCFSFLFLKSQKHKNILLVYLAYLLLVIYFMHLKIKKNKNIFVFLKPMQNRGAEIAETCSLFHFSSFFCNSK